MQDMYSRTELLIGKEAVEKLKNSRVAIFGVGGVGGYTVEALARSGVGTFDLIDNDKFSLSNLNRQIYATLQTVGLSKVEVAKERIESINKSARVNIYETFYTPETAEQFDFSQYDYVVDAIDTVVGKISLIEQAKKCGVPVISAMGAGNKLDATKFEVADISKTSVCPLARVIRTELKKRKIENVKCVYSKEVPKKSELKDENTQKPIPASISFVPSVVGLIIAGEVVKDLIR
ncbi:MAG: tRNA threonylcarbamoyladenosine dehydratase [bacterium]|nr:tRNA threonylcarbamoyladenosine dehydratase [bacterium]